MKNDRTPRTLADCEFTVGHPTVPRRRAGDSAANLLGLAVILVMMAACGVMLATAF